MIDADELDRRMAAIVQALEFVLGHPLDNRETDLLRMLLVVAWVWPPGLTMDAAVAAGIAVAAGDGSYYV